MKKYLLLVFSALSVSAFAQPVISNGNNIAAPGFSTPVSYAIPASGVGNAGANQTWDFSSLSFTPVGTLNTIDPATSPFAASFPTSNYAYTLATTYSYFQASSSKMEVLAYSITSPGSGNDFSPNPRTVLKFPFSYNDTETDTWQKVGGSTNNVTITYDGYGTLITPSATYSNVVRVKEDYGGGAVDYQWYILNPLMSILTYSNGNNTLYLAQATTPTAIEVQNTPLHSIKMYPNPSRGQLTFHCSGLPPEGPTELTIITAKGQVIFKSGICEGLSSVDLNSASRGMYFYQFSSNQKILTTGNFILE
jgi:hypothetical protein